MDIQQNTIKPPVTWLERPLANSVRVNFETLAYVTLIILATVTRFYDLESRVMSHDETSHVYFSWLYEQGNGYSHDPVTHGPFQFHIVPLAYFIFGDSDTTARIPAALFSLATVGFLWYYRRFLGKAGALIGAILMLISPYMLYYGRYVRNEAFVGLYGVLMLWSMLRYFETGKPAHLYWLTLTTTLHFATKETAFIYQAQALIFLAIFLIFRLASQTWPVPGDRNRFIMTILFALLILTFIGSYQVISGRSEDLSATSVAPPAVPGQAQAEQPASQANIIILAAVIAIGIAVASAIYFVLHGYGWENLRRERAFDLAVVLGTMVLPMLAPFPVKMLGINPIEYTNSQSLISNAVFIVIFAAGAVAIGFAWNWRLWLANTAIFYSIFTVLYTSLFSNGFGFMTGLVGSLGYWLEQQGVFRGSQPWYYYGLIQIPIYEFLPALGSLAALLYALKKGIDKQLRFSDGNTLLPEIPSTSFNEFEDEKYPVPVLPLLGFWSITSLIAFSIAGEKMPWLTFHITLPMILTSAWFLNKLIESTDWSMYKNQRGVLLSLILPVFFLSALAAIGTLLSPNPPFQGQELPQLQITSTFITALLTALFSGWGLTYLSKAWLPGQLYRVLTVFIFVLLSILTARAAFRAAYINYDNATEYLVYAHMARGPKEALEQIEEISNRTTGGLGLRVAYDDDVTYPFWWYLRNYPNKDFYGPNPTRAQRDAVAILVGEENFGKIEPVVGQAYQRYDYIRIWWPNQDYFDLNFDRIFDALTDPQMRAAIFNVWLNRDYTDYAALTGADFSLENWRPANLMRLYVRKDVITSLWNYGVTPSPQEVVADPYEGKGITLTADQVIGNAGSEPGQLKRPRGIALAQDNSLYVADTENHRIQHFSSDGVLLNTWGSFAASTDSQPAPPGFFNEPWGIAVGPDGSVYVADTWNHRIQKFTANGEFIITWGFGISQTDDPFGFYGPRSVAVDAQGRVFVTDTGNKRVVVFDSQGQFLTKFGQSGLAPGEFEEPVGLAIDSQGALYVADTWNQRIQVFIPASDGTFTPLIQWDIVGWYSNSIDNKPFLAVDPLGNVFVADPEGYRILQFNQQGEFVRFWGDYSTGLDGFDLPTALAANQEGVWVSDTNNNRLLHFTLPAAP
jgi:predicted membrane-bound mannosyltransferase/DNA-binding beta-propeller fold protein YncE